MKIVLFEDSQFANLLPLTYFRPVWELRCGIQTLGEKIRKLFPKQSFGYSARQYLMDYYLHPAECFHPSLPQEEVLFINGRILATSSLRKNLKEISAKTALISDDNTIIAWRAEKQNLTFYFEQGIIQSERVLNDFPSQKISLALIQYPWDLIDRNGDQICQDAKQLKKLGQHFGRFDKGCHILNPKNIYLAKGSRVMPGTVLDAESGPIWIGQNTTVLPNAVLRGPLAIGNDSLVKIGAKLYQNTSIGPVCKVGGEVEGSIIQGFSNKQHDGFLGHAYLGAWINIGADTNNSDLKNNYGQISVYLNNRTVETGKRFLGLMMGDHTKTAINTMFNTGTVVGVNCNIYGEGFPPKFIPSFSWGGSGGMKEYQFEKALEVARVVMGRRNIPFTEKYMKLFEAVKQLTLQIENRARIND